MNTAMQKIYEELLSLQKNIDEGCMELAVLAQRFEEYKDRLEQITVDLLYEA